MGEAGVLATAAFDDGATGWRRRGMQYSGGGGYDGSGGGGVGILQLLTPNQDSLVPILGKKTGWDVGMVNKREDCAALGNDWVTISGW